MWLELPIKTVSELNARDHWRTVHNRKKKQQEEVYYEWKRQYHNVKVKLPCMVLLTRTGPNRMDTDNLISSFKHIRDEVARIIGVDDGNDLIRFEYDQRQTAKKQHWVKIEIFEADE